MTKAEMYVPNADGSYNMLQDQYSYDPLNRLQSVSEFQWGTQAVFTQAYTYDRWGNRQINQAASSTNINTQQFGINTANNRLGVPSGQSGQMLYDAAGNLTTDTYSRADPLRTYDGENRLITNTDNSSQVSRYAYDSSGSRVRRNVNYQETWQVFGIGGELIAEYTANASPTSVQKEYGYRGGELLVTATSTADIQWLVSDHLGTPRMIPDKTGTLSGVKRHDYLPFGEEIYAGTGGRTAQQGYSADNVRQKYTKYERDNETGLDFAEARYFSSTQGRFTSVDPFAGSMRASDPQSFNRYIYVENSPVNRIDSSGLDWTSDASQSGSSDGGAARRWNGNGYVGNKNMFDVFEDFPDPEDFQIQNPDASGTGGNPQDACADYDLVQLVTDGTGIVRGVGSNRNVPGVDTHYQLADGTVHTFHIYGDTTATNRTGIYVPVGFSKIELVGKSTVVAENPKTGEVINVYHVLVSSAQALKQNQKVTNAAGSRYVGEIGGPGGAGRNDVHAHLTLFRDRAARDFVEKWRMEPTRVLKNGLHGFPRNIDSSVSKYLRDIRSLIQ